MKKVFVVMCESWDPTEYHYNGTKEIIGIFTKHESAELLCNRLTDQEQQERQSSYVNWDDDDWDEYWENQRKEFFEENPDATDEDYDVHCHIESGVSTPTYHHSYHVEEHELEGE
jgi:hypothetical protein